MACKLFLFDLDGTVVDTAPDLAEAANAVRTARALEIGRASCRERVCQYV